MSLTIKVDLKVSFQRNNKMLYSLWLKSILYLEVNYVLLLNKLQNILLRTIQFLIICHGKKRKHCDTFSHPNLDLYLSPAQNFILLSFYIHFLCSIYTPTVLVKLNTVGWSNYSNSAQCDGQVFVLSASVVYLVGFYEIHIFHKVTKQSHLPLL